MHSAAFNLSRVHRPRCRTFFGSVTQPTKEPFRRGIFFGVIAGILITTGGILTYIGFSSSSSKRLSTVGPLLIGLSLLLILFCARQLVQYRKLQHGNHDDCTLCRSSVATMVIERDTEGTRTVTVVMDMINADTESVGRPDQEQTDVDILRPPSYNEAVESSGGDDWFVVPEGEPPPSYEAAVQDSEQCSTDSAQDRNGVNEAWVDSDHPEMTHETKLSEMPSKEQHH